MTLHIKNMVCDRCKMVVQAEVEKLGLHPLSVTLGEVTFSHDLTPAQKQDIQQALTPIGFAIIDDKKSRIIEQIKTRIVELVHRNNNQLKTNLSDYLSDALHHDYKYLTSLFTEVEGVTIEKFFIAQKIERVKELLVYDELSLSEIANQLNYSSVAHLSAQFKKVTGLTPSHFKAIGAQKRQSLDQLTNL